MRFLAVSLLLVVFGLPTAGAASGSGPDDDMDAFLDRLRQKSSELSSISTRFVQQKYLAMFDKPVRFEGRLALVRPDRLRWEFTRPVPSALVFNGENGLRCNRDSEPVRFSLSRDPVMKAVAEQLWLWLGGDYRSLEGRFLLEKKEDASLLVKPLNVEETEYLHSVLMEFDPETLQPVQVEIVESGGDLTRIVFDPPELNPELPAGLFEECGLDE